MKVFHIVTVSKSIKLMKGQIKFLNKYFDVQLVTSMGEELTKYDESKVHIVDMNREISLFQDFYSLIKMVLLLHKERPEIVNSGTPKAGLIGTLASFITRRPIRIYTVRGLRLETVSGVKYKILYMMEKLAMYCATDIIAVSNSLKEKIIDLNLTNENKIKVLGKGSSNGLNLSKFNLEDNELETEIQQRIKNKFVLGFIGRITRDKGISELLQAFTIIKENQSNAILMIIGDFELGDPIPQEDINYIKDSEDVIQINHVENPINYYNNFDVMIFPTHREGFGNVSIEAQALKVPVITYNVTGAKDTVLNNETGFIIEKNDIKSMVEKINYLIENEEKRKEMGIKGRSWVFNNFSNEIIWNELYELYSEKLKKD